MADRLRARRRIRRRLIVLGAAAVIVAAGVGAAWAVRGGNGPRYRLADATTGTVTQTLHADGALAASQTATSAFAASGTVSSVRVGVGSAVRAGQTLATLDPVTLRQTVTDAQNTIAAARQKLSDDEQAQATGTETTSTSSSSSIATQSAVTTDSATTIRLISARVTTPRGKTKTKPNPTPTAGGIDAAQRSVVAAQQALDRALHAQDQAVAALAGACAPGDDTTPTTLGATAGTTAALTGSVGSAAAVVTLLDANNATAVTTSSNPQQVAANGTYTFAGLSAGAAYTVQIARTAVLDTTRCTGAVTAVSTAQHQVDAADQNLDTALTELAHAVAALATTTPTTPSTGTTGGRTGTGSTRTGSTSSTRGATSSGQSSGSRTSATSTGSAGNNSSVHTVTITAQQIAADTQAIDLGQAALAVAQSALGNATLSAPISGTVAAVSLATGDTVSADSSSSTITIVGHGGLSVTVDIDLADIDLVKAGQTALVSVDGQATAVAGRVSYVGQLNSASSTGTSSTYPVTVQLDSTPHGLYDGMGASVGIIVGTATHTLTVPLSAVHTIGRLHTVEVYAGGAAKTTLVTTGLAGDDTVQVTSGLHVGQQVVLADLSAAIPSSNTFSRRNGSGLTGLTGGGGGGPPVGGGPAGGFSR